MIFFCMYPDSYWSLEAKTTVRKIHRCLCGLWKVMENRKHELFLWTKNPSLLLLFFFWRAIRSVSMRCDIPYDGNAHEIDLGRGWADENVNSIHKRFDAQVQCTSIKASRWTRTWKVQYTSAKNADAYRTNWMQFEFTKSKSKCSSSFDMKAENAEGSILNAQVYKLISNRTVISEWKKLWRIVDVEKWKRRVGIKRKSIGQT